MQNRFKQLLEEKNLTANRFAALIKVNASAMSHILNGHRKPGFEVLGKIAEAFPDVNLNWLISGKGAIYNNQLSDGYTIQQAEAMSQKEDSNPSSTPQLVKTSSSKKKIKRIILFFEDESFEDYGN